MSSHSNSSPCEQCFESWIRKCRKTGTGPSMKNTYSLLEPKESAKEPWMVSSFFSECGFIEMMIICQVFVAIEVEWSKFHCRKMSVIHRSFRTAVCWKVGYVLIRPRLTLGRDTWKGVITGSIKWTVTWSDLNDLVCKQAETRTGLTNTPYFETRGSTLIKGFITHHESRRRKSSLRWYSGFMYSCRRFARAARA